MSGQQRARWELATSVTTPGELVELQLVLPDGSAGRVGWSPRWSAGQELETQIGENGRVAISAWRPGTYQIVPPELSVASTTGVESRWQPPSLTLEVTSSGTVEQPATFGSLRFPPPMDPGTEAVGGAVIVALIAAVAWSIWRRKRSPSRSEGAPVVDHGRDELGEVVTRLESLRTQPARAAWCSAGQVVVHFVADRRAVPRGRVTPLPLARAWARSSDPRSIERFFLEVDRARFAPADQLFADDAVDSALQVVREERSP